MVDLYSWENLAFLILVGTIGPAAAYMYFIWQRDVFDREPRATVIATFLYGAIVVVIASILIEMGANWLLESVLLITFAGMSSVVIAPITEEFFKWTGVHRITGKPYFNEVDDGIVYGVAVGLGFASVENILYSYNSLLEGGLSSLVITIVIRAISSMVFHADATAISGYGLSRTKMGSTPLLVPVTLLAAILLHAFFNYIATFLGFIGIIYLLILSVGLFIPLARALS